MQQKMLVCTMSRKKNQKETSNNVIDYNVSIG